MRWSGMLSVAAALAASSCGGKVGETVRPKDHTATGALGGGGGGGVECAGEAKYARPLIVDLDPESRVDLEAGMKSGVVAVRYDCANLRVLSNCKIPGVYDYAGVSRKEQVVQITSADELSANLPLSKAKLSGELQSGRSIDLALVLVGRSSTAVGKLLREELGDGCGDATHFVQNATLGAFSMVTGSVGKVAVVAEVFQYGAEAKSASERKAMSNDGSLEACRSSTPDASGPPGECRTPVRVELVPILGAPPIGDKTAKGDKGDKGDKKKDAVAQENPCPPGYKFEGELCSKDPSQAYLCDPSDAAECEAQCGKGSAQSCYNYGVLLQKQQKSKQATPFFKKGCEGEVADACTAYAWVLVDFDETPAALQANREALKLFNRACVMGSGQGCYGAGTLVDGDGYKMPDKQVAVKNYERGCSLGDPDSCFSIAYMLFKGDTVKQDANKGLELLQRSCRGGSADMCYEVGRTLAAGKYGLAKDPAGAYAADRSACLMEAIYCNDAARTALKVGKEQEAFRWATRGCEDDDVEACTRLGDLYRDGRGVAKDEAKAKQIWTKGCEDGNGWEDACKRLGIKMKE